MNKYRITIDGKSYEMEIELLAENGAPQPAAGKVINEGKNPPEVQNSTAAAPSSKKPPVSSAGAVVAPMPGTVIRIEKGEGEAVKAGELVLVLEAMKMENEILAPAEGKIVSMNCQVGRTVAGGDVLFEVK